MSYELAEISLTLEDKKLIAEVQGCGIGGLIDRLVRRLRERSEYIALLEAGLEEAAESEGIDFLEDFLRCNPEKRGYADVVIARETKR